MFNETLKDRKVKFLAKFIDSNGHEHYAVHSYDRISGFVDMMRDFKFEDHRYPLDNIEYEMLRDEQERIMRESMRFQVKECLEEDPSCFKVIDTQKNLEIATFYNKQDAEDYAFIREGNNKYLEDVEDDPFL